MPRGFTFSGVLQTMEDEWANSQSPVYGISGLLLRGSSKARFII